MPLLPRTAPQCTADRDFRAWGFFSDLENSSHLQLNHHSLGTRCKASRPNGFHRKTQWCLLEASSLVLLSHCSSSPFLDSQAFCVQELPLTREKLEGLASTSCCSPHVQWPKELRVNSPALCPLVGLKLGFPISAGYPSGS